MHGGDRGGSEALQPPRQRRRQELSALGLPPDPSRGAQAMPRPWGAAGGLEEGGHEGGGAQVMVSPWDPPQT